MKNTSTLQSTPTNYQQTSIESRDKIDLSHKNKYRNQIYSFIAERPNGATCDEVEVSMGLRHQTASCFIRFLTQDDFLYDSGERRITRANRKAIVWKIKEKV